MCGVNAFQEIGSIPLFPIFMFILGQNFYDTINFREKLYKVAK